MITHTELAQTEGIINRGKEILNDLQALRDFDATDLYEVKVEYNSNSRCFTSPVLLKMIMVYGKEALIKKLEEELEDIPNKLRSVSLLQKQCPVMSEKEKEEIGFSLLGRTTHLDGT